MSLGGLLGEKQQIVIPNRRSVKDLKEQGTGLVALENLGKIAAFAGIAAIGAIVGYDMPQPKLVPKPLPPGVQGPPVLEEFPPGLEERIKSAALHASIGATGLYLATEGNGLAPTVAGTTMLMGMLASPALKTLATMFQSGDTATQRIPPISFGGLPVNTIYDLWNAVFKLMSGQQP